MARICTIFLLLPGVAAFAPSTAKGTALAERVDALVAQLATDEFRAAEDALIAVGPAALPHLPDWRRARDPQTARSLRTIEAVLQKRAAAADVTGSTVRLPGEPVTLRQAIGAIREQTGNRLVLDPSAGPIDQDQPLTGIAGEAPFWRTVDAMCKAAGLAPQFQTAPDGALRLRRAEEDHRRSAVAYVGPFRVDVPAAKLRQEVGVLSTTVRLAWEPRLHVVTVAAPADHWHVAATSAEGAEPSEFPLLGGGQREATVADGATAVEFSLPFDVPRGFDADHVSLRGEFRVVLPTAEASFVFDRVAAGPPVSRKQGDVRVTLTKALSLDGDIIVTMLVHYDNAQGALESFRGWIGQYVAELRPREPGGEAIQPDLAERVAHGPNGVALRFTFNDVKEPTRYALHYRCPTAIVAAPVEFTIRPIPVP